VREHAAVGRRAVEHRRGARLGTKPERGRRDDDVLFRDAGVVDPQVAVMAAADPDRSVDRDLAARGRTRDGDQLDLGLGDHELDAAEVELVAARQRVHRRAASDPRDRVAVQLRRAGAHHLERPAAAHRALDQRVAARHLRVGEQDVVRARIAAEPDRLRGGHDVDPRERSGLERKPERHG
jgi:hypothetical protein